MSDIVEQLRDHHDKLAAYPMLDAVADDCLSAAAEITRLRERVAHLERVQEADNAMRQVYVRVLKATGFTPEDERVIAACDAAIDKAIQGASAMKTENK